MMGAEDREKFNDAILLVLKMEEGPTSQGMQATSRTGKDKKTDFPIKPPGGT